MVETVAVTEACASRIRATALPGALSRTWPLLKTCRARRMRRVRHVEACRWDLAGGGSCWRWNPVVADFGGGRCPCCARRVCGHLAEEAARKSFSLPNRCWSCIGDSSIVACGRRKPLRGCVFHVKHCLCITGNPTPFMSRYLAILACAKQETAATALESDKHFVLEMVLYERVK